jgi:hypothetical protein
MSREFHDAVRCARTPSHPLPHQHALTSRAPRSVPLSRYMSMSTATPSLGAHRRFQGQSSPEPSPVVPSRRSRRGLNKQRASARQSQELHLERPSARQSQEMSLGSPSPRQSQELGVGRPSTRQSQESGLGRPSARQLQELGAAYAGLRSPQQQSSYLRRAALEDLGESEADAASRSLLAGGARALSGSMQLNDSRARIADHPVAFDASHPSEPADRTG